MNFKQTIAILFVFGILLRLFVIGLPIIDDNGAVGFHLRAHNEVLINFVAVPHPPIDNWFYDFSGILFGINSAALRIVPVFFSLLTAIIVFFTAKKFYSNQIAVFSTAIYLFAFFPFVSSIAMSPDNTVLTLIAAAMLYFLLELLQGNRNRSVFFLGILLGFAIMTKAQAVVFAFPVIAVLFSNRKNNKRFVIETTTFFAAAAIVAGALLLIIFLAMPNDFSFFIETVFLHLNAYDKIIGFLQSIMQLVPLAIALTPLFFLPAYFFFRHNEKEKIPLIWIIGISITYLLLVPASVGADFIRFFSVVSPAATILISVAITKTGLEKKDWLRIAALSIVFFIAFFALNQWNSDSSFYLIGATFLGQRISHAALFAFWGLSVVLLAIIAVKKIFLKRFDKNLFAFFLSACIAFNLLMVSNYFSQPEYGFVLQSTIEELQQNGFQKPFYSWHEEIPFYLGFSATQHFFKDEKSRAFSESLGLTDKNSFFGIDIRPETLERSIIENGGTVALLNYPKRYFEKYPSYNSMMKILEKNCALRKHFAMLDAESIIFDCKKN